MKKNEVITCKIIGIQDYGMFVKCGEYNGLVHISEISDQFVKNIGDIFLVGDNVDLYILDIDEDEKKLKLSYKKNHPIHHKIRKNVSVVIGFQSLNRNLPTWINQKKRDKNDQN